jgi:hypothetical protein
LGGKGLRRRGWEGTRPMGFGRGFDQEFAWGAEGILRRGALGGGRGNRCGTRGMEVSWDGLKNGDPGGGYFHGPIRGVLAEQRGVGQEGSKAVRQ